MRSSSGNSQNKSVGDVALVIFIHTIMCRDGQTDRPDENNTAYRGRCLHGTSRAADRQSDVDKHSQRHCLTIRAAYSLHRREPKKI